MLPSSTQQPGNQRSRAARRARVRVLAIGGLVNPSSVHLVGSVSGGFFLRLVVSVVVVVLLAGLYQVIPQRFGSVDLATAVVGDLLAGDEALQDGQTGEVEDRDEEGGDEVGDQQDDEAWDEWLLDLGSFRGR